MYIYDRRVELPNVYFGSRRALYLTWHQWKPSRSLSLYISEKKPSEVLIFRELRSYLHWPGDATTGVTEVEASAEKLLGKKGSSVFFFLLLLLLLLLSIISWKRRRRRLSGLALMNDLRMCPTTQLFSVAANGAANPDDAEYCQPSRLNDRLGTYLFWL